MAGSDEHVERDQALRRFQRELRQFEQIPGAPEVLGKVLELTAADKTVSTRALAEVVACDAPLTARLLALANGWVVGSARTITSIPQAILLLGLHTYGIWPPGCRSGRSSAKDAASHQRVVTHCGYIAPRWAPSRNDSLNAPG